MKNIVVSAFVLGGVLVFGQNSEKLFLSKKDRPTVVVNDSILGNMELLRTLPESAIKNVEVHKRAAPGKSDPLNFNEYGLLRITAEATVVTKSQEELRSFMGLPAETPVYMDGFLLKDEKYGFAVASIKEIEIIEPNETDLISAKAINVWTLGKEARFGPSFLRTADSLIR